MNRLSSAGRIGRNTPTAYPNIAQGQRSAALGYETTNTYPNPARVVERRPIMPQSLAQIYLHIVFSTKNRYPWLQTPDLRADVHAYLSATLNNLDCPCLITGGVADHIHTLCRLGRKTSVADLNSLA